MMVQHPARYWQVIARNSPQFVDEQWRERLMQMLGSKPRRISLFAETVMYGALDCIGQAPDWQAQSLSTVRIATLKGPCYATLKILKESEHELPMPFAFLQSQLSQGMVALLKRLDWQGDASMMITEHDTDFIKMTLIAAGNGDVLLGRTEEFNHMSDLEQTFWLLLRPCDLPTEVVLTTQVPQELSQMEYVGLSPAGLIYA